MRRRTGIVQVTLVCLLLAGLMVWPATGVIAGTPYYVGTLTDDDGTNTTNCSIPTNTDCSLRSAIAAATSGTDSITFRSGLSGTITLTNGTLKLTTSVTITGPGADVITVSGDNTVRVFTLGGNASYPSFDVSGLTIAAGGYNIIGGGVVGGGMYIGLAESVILWDMAFSTNMAELNGGALFIDRSGNQQSPIVINSSTFYGNIVTRAVPEAGGGAIYSEDRAIIITNSTFINNHTHRWGGSGGAIMALGPLSLVNSTVTQNDAADAGGGLYTVGAITSLTNTIVTGNVSFRGVAHDLMGAFQGDNNLYGSSVISGNNNVVGVDPIFGKVGYYGGSTQTIPLLPGSPAIGAGYNGSVTPLQDQRGIDRTGRIDIGAFQSQGFTLTKVSGDQQSRLVGNNFPEPFVVAVESAYGEPVEGGRVTFNGPAVGASIDGNPLQSTVTADGQAIQMITSNATAGAYTVSADASGATSVAFALTNIELSVVATVQHEDGTPYIFDTWALQPVTITLTATGADVASILYSIDGGGTQAYTAPFTISSDGSHTLTYWNTDSLGASGQSQTFIINVDRTAPDSSLLTYPEAVSVDPDAVFTFSGSDTNPILRIECAFDTDTFSTCVSPMEIRDVLDGSHTIQVRAVDVAGHVDPTPASYTWINEVYPYPPDTIILTHPAEISNDQYIRFTYSGSTLGVSGFECSLNLAPFHSCDNEGIEYVIPYGYDGPQAFQVRAVDRMGVVDPTPASFWWVADLQFPITRMGEHPPRVSDSPSATFTFSAEDNWELAGFVCLLDGPREDPLGGFPCTSPLEINELQNGQHKLVVWGVDTAGNYDFFPASYSWTVSGVDPSPDPNEAPTALALSYSSVPENFAVGTTVGSFSTTDPDATDTHSYSLVTGEGDSDNAAFTISGSTLQTAAVFDFESQGSYNIRVRSTDGGGLTIEQQFTINVVDGNEAPTALALAPSSVAENSPIGTTVGTFTTTDPDAGSNHGYTFVAGTGDTDNAAFTISGTTLLTATTLDADLQSSYSIRVRTDDGYAGTFEQTFTITVTPVEVAAATISLDPATLSQAYDGSPHAATATTTPGGLNYSVTYDGSPTPPTVVGTYAVVATIVDQQYVGSVSGSLTIYQADQTISMTSTAPANAVYGDAYTPTATGGGSGKPVVFAASGACAYNSGSGVVTMVATGPCTVTADQAGDANHQVATQQTQTFSVAKADLAVVANAATMVQGGGVPVFDTTVTGLVNGDSFALLGGTCHAEVSGSPVSTSTAAGVYPAAITCSGVDTTNYEVNYTSGTLTINAAPQITSADATMFTSGVEGRFTISGTGFPAITFSTTGSLPDGVHLSTDGVLSGTPAAGTGGNYVFDIVATNGVLLDATQMFTLTVNEASAFTSEAATTFQVGHIAVFNARASGDPAPTFSVQGTLPYGITFSRDGLLAGMPALGTGGVYQLTLVATNGTTPDATQAFTLTINEAPAITSTDAASFDLNAPGSQTITATGYPAATFSTAGPLPDGVTLAPNGILGGSATEGGTFPFTIIASNGIGPDASQSFTLTVAVPTIVAPDNMRVSNDTGSAGAVVNYPAPVTTGPVGDVTCTPSSGSVFPLGQTTVTCVSSLSDATASFTVTIVDKDPPVIMAPDSIVALPTTSTGGMVHYPAPGVTDNAAGADAICLPASGSLFKIGSTLVTCTATDAAGNTAKATFTVKVLSARELLQDLAQRIDRLPISGSSASQKSFRTALQVQLTLISVTVRGNIPLLPCMQLTAFDATLNQQVRLGRVTSRDAAQLLEVTEALRIASGCDSSVLRR